jgi:superfamily II DNA or RNA helicase
MIHGLLPTGAGKTLVGMLTVAWAARSALVVVPTLDLMHQWYALLRVRAASSLSWR